MAKKKKAKSRAAPTRSKIIEQCVIYVQALAAYDAGSSVDRTGNSDYADAGSHIRKARGAMIKLIGCSPHCTPGATPLNALELYAKAGVLAVMYSLRKDEEPDEIELAYVRFFGARFLIFSLQTMKCPHGAPASIVPETQPAAAGRPCQTAEAVRERGLRSAPLVTRD